VESNEEISVSAAKLNVFVALLLELPHPASIAALNVSATTFFAVFINYPLRYEIITVGFF
jgi:hypothetical protein